MMGAIRKTKSKQNGLVLLISLVVLGVVSVISASLMNNALLEERMSAGMIAVGRIEQQATRAFTEAETWLNQQIIVPVLAEEATESMDVWSSHGLSVSGDQPWWRERDSQWWMGNAEPVDISADTPMSHFILEEILRVPPADSGINEQPEQVYYRITVRSAQGNGAAVLMQGTFCRYLYSPEQIVASELNEQQMLEALALLNAGTETGRLSWRRVQEH